MRKRIVAGNWKMNGTLQDGVALATGINERLKETPPGGVDIILCPPFTHISEVYRAVDNGRIVVGGQNCSAETSGAYTGEVSPLMLKSAGAEYVIIGHSERRSYYGESDEIIARKVVNALSVGLNVIFCCGETLKERESGIHFSLVEKQLTTGVFELKSDQFASIVIAYEPVWAIGTGVTATSAQAQEMHSYIRGLLEKRYGAEIADSTPILYGGSCNAANAAELFSMEDVDGGLIGGASLKADDFVTIIGSY